jgi:hypothetical protein
MTWLLALFLSTAVAGASDFYVEGPAVDARREATDMSRAATDLGYQSRVVRRFAQGEGWRFVLVVEGFEEESAATEAATAVATSVGRPLVVFGQNGGQATRIQQVAPVADTPVTPSGTTDPGAFDGDLGDILTRAAVAHGGTTHPVRVAQSLLFRFRRTLPSGLVALHTVARAGGNLYVQVDIEAGEGQSSRAWIIDDNAWLSVGEGEPESKDVVWSREQLEQFLPERVLALPLGFGQAVAERREFQDMYADGEARSGSTRCLVLKYDGDQVSAPLALYLEEDTLLTRRVVSGMDAREYDDFRDVSTGAKAPFHLTVSREGETVDEVQVLDLDLDPNMERTWFTSPE